MSGYRFVMCVLRSSKDCWLCGVSLPKETEACFDNWNKGPNKTGQATCLACAQREQIAGKGEIRPETETPASTRAAGISVNVHANGGGEQIIHTGLIEALKELTNEFRLLREVITERLPASGLISNPSTDFSPPMQDTLAAPDLDIFRQMEEEKPKLDERLEPLLTYLKAHHKPTASLVQTMARVVAWTDEEVHLSFQDRFLQVVENKKEHIAAGLKPKQKLTISGRSFN